MILSQCTIDDKTLLKMVADETHVSKAMLVKIAKKLGFDGFRSLRAALAKHNRLPLAKARQELSDQSTARAATGTRHNNMEAAAAVFLTEFAFDALWQISIRTSHAQEP